MRICSLLPSATEILFDLGLGDSVVAVTHECDYPNQALSKPKITSSRLDAEKMSSHEIDENVHREIEGGAGLYHLDSGQLKLLRPDLIVTQELCEVCAVSYSVVRNAVKMIGGDTQVVSLEPRNTSDIIDTIQQLGRMTGTQERANTIVSEMQRRIDRVKDITKDVDRPRVYCMEWLSPPFAAGHWVPEMAQIAGGIDVAGQIAKPSRKINWDEAREADPEVIILMPCGFTVKRILAEKNILLKYEGFKSCKAFVEKKIFAVDANSFFSRPGPRIVDGIEILLSILHPKLYKKPFSHDVLAHVEF